MAQKKIKFQVISWNAEDKTNAELQIEDENEPTEVIGTILDEKILGWWNWFKQTNFENLKSYLVTIFEEPAKENQFVLKWKISPVFLCKTT